MYCHLVSLFGQQVRAMRVVLSLVIELWRVSLLPIDEFFRWPHWRHSRAILLTTRRYKRTRIYACGGSAEFPLRLGQTTRRPAIYMALYACAHPVRPATYANRRTIRTQDGGLFIQSCVCNKLITAFDRRSCRLAWRPAVMGHRGSGPGRSTHAYAVRHAVGRPTRDARVCERGWVCRRCTGGTRLGDPVRRDTHRYARRGRPARRQGVEPEDHG